MKYDVLQNYQEYLKKNNTNDTARVYYNRIDSLLEGQYLINNVNDIDLEKVIDKLKEVKYKNHFSQCKNALIHLYEFEGVAFPVQYMDKIKELESQTKKKYRKMKVVYYGELKKKIDYIRNKKLKLSYQTMLNTGLRIFELSQILKEECLISSELITFHFTGKGGHREKVELYKKDNIKLFEDLKELIENTQDNKRVFYSVSYLQNQAKKHGFTCHDLRRTYAKLEYKKTKSKKHVKEKLRHTSIKNTNIYINSKIKL